MTRIIITTLSTHLNFSRHLNATSTPLHLSLDKSLNTVLWLVQKLAGSTGGPKCLHKFKGVNTIVWKVFWDYTVISWDWGYLSHPHLYPKLPCILNESQICSRLYMYSHCHHERTASSRVWEILGQWGRAECDWIDCVHSVVNSRSLATTSLWKDRGQFFVKAPVAQWI